jgi:hypothetical protein
MQAFSTKNLFPPLSRPRTLYFLFAAILDYGFSVVTAMVPGTAAGSQATGTTLPKFPSLIETTKKKLATKLLPFSRLSTSFTRNL